MYTIQTVRCSSTPLKVNPFDATIQRFGRNFTSKARFLDMIANFLDKLSAPSTPAAKSANNNTNNTTPSTVQATTDPKKATTNLPPATKQTTTPNTLKSNKESIWESLRVMIALTATARYSRPSLLAIIVQVIVNAIGGHIFSHAIVLPFLGKVGIIGNSGGSDTVSVIIWLSCVFAAVFELFSDVNEAELHYSHYSSNKVLDPKQQRFYSKEVSIAIATDVVHKLKQSTFGMTMLAPIIAVATAPVWSHLVHLFINGHTALLSPPSLPAVVSSLFISYVTVILFVGIMVVQDVLTRWAVCAPGMDADVLMYRSSTPQTAATKFLAEDLFIQSILMFDGGTVDKVITAPGAKVNQYAMGATNHQDEEVARNEEALSSFADWIQLFSTTQSGKLSDDILRMCLLESLGGGGSSSSSATTKATPFYFGESRHSASVRKRLDLSAATTSPGRQPIAAPLVRALCAFSGGLGEAMSKCYRQEEKNGKIVVNNSAELWKLPPGSLTSAEFAIIASARLAVMNLTTEQRGRIVVNSARRHERLSLLLPCVLQSAFKLRSGVFEYALAVANTNGVNLTTFEKSGKGDGLSTFIATKCPELHPLISACDNSAKMVIQTLTESGDRALEGVLLRGNWKADMQKWLVELNCQISGAC